jgi:hypothetical protein
MRKHERPQPEARGVVDELRQDHPTMPLKALAAKPEAVPIDRPEGMTDLAVAMRALVEILPGLKAALERQAGNRPRIEPLALRLDELADALGVSRRAIERERSAGRFPAADLTIGKMPLWRVETIRDWLTQPDRQGRRSGR